MYDILHYVFVTALGAIGAYLLAHFSDLLVFAGLVVAIIQLRLLIKQISMTREQMESQQQWDSKDVTFQYVATFRSELEETNLLLQEHFNLLLNDGTPIESSRIVEALKNNKIRLHLYNLVAYCEEMAIGLKHEYFHERAAYDYLCVIITSTYKSLKPYIDHRRRETGIYICEYFEKLALRWDREMKADPLMSSANRMSAPEDSSRSKAQPEQNPDIT